MSILSDRPGCEGNVIFPGKNSAVTESSGWDIEYKLINVANSTISLHSILKQYNISLEQMYSATGWTHRCNCPFSDHRETRPSFGYNSTEDRFNCFGCHRSGKAVEFISFMENKPKKIVAKELLGDSFSVDDIFETTAFDYSRLERLLFEYADYIREFKRGHSYCDKAVTYAGAVTWNLDVYLMKHVPSNSIILDDLEVRVLKLREQLEAYGESI